MKGYDAVDYLGLQVPVGTKIKFQKEKLCYTVMASNVAFLVCTKPLNMIRKTGTWGLKNKGRAYEHEKTVLYTVVDRKEGVRGTENLIFGFGAETKEQCEEMLERLTTGDSEVSHRNRVTLDVEKFYIPKLSTRKSRRKRRLAIQ